MIVIAVIGQKGGTGKTTIATGLAVAALQAGLAPAVLDLDPQANAWNWKKRRGMERDPAVKATSPSALRDYLETLRGLRADIVFIDTPGRSESAALQAARLADLVLIPVQMQIFDMETLMAVKDDILRLAGDPPAVVVINRAHPNVRGAADETRDTIEKVYGLTVAPVHLSNRAAYADAPIAGLAAQELDPDGRAAEELSALFQFVHKSTGQHAHKSTERRAING
jgi:chromosome partitioning protein